MPICFNISRAAAWAPGLASAEDWSAWFARLESSLGRHGDIEATPALEFVGAMARRRLSRLSKMALACSHAAAGALPAMPIVFGSRYGEMGITLDLLTSLAQEESLSPTAFTLSVHNAAIGQMSIVN